MIALDPTTGLPPYEQVRGGLVAAIESGELTPGDRLPTVRRLAHDLDLAANTVARAYRELEAAGVIETRGRAGSFVAGDRREAEMRQAAAAYVEKVRALGGDRALALALVERLAGASH